MYVGVALIVGLLYSMDRLHKCMCLQCLVRRSGSRIIVIRSMSGPLQPSQIAIRCTSGPLQPSRNSRRRPYNRYKAVIGALATFTRQCWAIEIPDKTQDLNPGSSKDPPTFAQAHSRSDLLSNPTIYIDRSTRVYIYISIYSMYF